MNDVDAIPWRDRPWWSRWILAPAEYAIAFVMLFLIMGAAVLLISWAVMVALWDYRPRFRGPALLLCLASSLGAQPVDRHGIQVWQAEHKERVYDIAEWTRGSETVLSGWVMSGGHHRPMVEAKFDYSTGLFTARFFDEVWHPVAIKYVREEEHEGAPSIVAVIQGDVVRFKQP